MVVAAGTALVLDATNQFAPANGGLGGQLDITGTNLVVAASDQLGNFGTVTNGVFTANSAYAGYLFLDPDMLSQIGIESILLGGYRSNTTEGTRITATAPNLEVATDAAHALSGPELLFTSLAPTRASASVRGVVVDSGSVITAKGAVAGGSTAALVFGADPVAQYNSSGTLTGYTAGISGDGSLLRVSNGGLVNVVRHFVPGVYQVPATTPAPNGPVSAVALGNLTIGAGVILAGNTLTLDSSGTTSVPIERQAHRKELRSLRQHHQSRRRRGRSRGQRRSHRQLRRRRCRAAALGLGVQHLRQQHVRQRQQSDRHLHPRWRRPLQRRRRQQHRARTTSS